MFNKYFNIFRADYITLSAAQTDPILQTDSLIKPLTYHIGDE